MKENLIPVPPHCQGGCKICDKSGDICLVPMRLFEQFTESIDRISDDELAEGTHKMANIIVHLPDSYIAEYQKRLKGVARHFFDWHLVTAKTLQGEGCAKAAVISFQKLPRRLKERLHNGFLKKIATLTRN